jgi:hypothetical protein
MTEKDVINAEIMYDIVEAIDDSYWINLDFLSSI